ncbi:LRR receptor-like serine/threonine-protein kinase GSO1-like [Hibiscus syriacus]|uniref:LRR receptor-like serine/threonine-protein kinase GSO1-like n=1 Tax=Hibiscus syriacus TaxID=106335 RepID=A0A6A2X5W1_HIBSY|nr:LRR receptor-like serine/threonine-protein kinase GSO1-like [Hibiscus syriacus]
MTKMDYNKDETIRAKELAEKKLAEMGVVGAKRFALKAQNLYPELDGLPQLLATLDVYISAYKKINGEVNWYRVLAVQPFADEDTIRKHYRKMALVLHPDKNKSVGADGAFKILSQAWNFLSDKAKIIAYNQKRNLRGSYTNVSHGKSSSSATTSPNGFHKFPDENISNTSGWNGATYSTPAPSTMRNDTFWTTCNSCKMHFEYSRVYINVNLPCINCHTHFFVVETPAPAINTSSKYTPFSDFMQQQNSASLIMLDTRDFLSAHNKSQTDITRGKNLQMKCHPSQKTDAGVDLNKGPLREDPINGLLGPSTIQGVMFDTSHLREFVVSIDIEKSSDSIRETAGTSLLGIVLIRPVVFGVL